MITHIAVILSTNNEPPKAYFGRTELKWPDGMSEEAIYKRILIEVEGCALTALDEYWEA